MTGAAADLAPLAAWLAPRLCTDTVRLEGVRRHSEGFSWLTYTLTAAFSDRSGRPRRRPLAVRVQPPDGLLAPYDVVPQYELQRSVHESGLLPVAEPLWLERDHSVLGAPFFVMERVRGTVPVPGEPAPFPREARARVGRRLAEFLARLHRRPLRKWDVDFGVTLTSPEQAVDRWEAFYAESTVIEVPAIRAAFAWLRGHLPATQRMVFCHGDYRYGNLMFAGERVVAVFDWELAHAGDPLEDLAWTLLPALRTDPALVAETVTPGEFVALYERAAGFGVDRAALRFWSILNHVKAAAIYLRGVKAFEEGRVPDLRMGALGHRYLYLVRALVAEMRAAA